MNEYGDSEPTEATRSAGSAGEQGPTPSDTAVPPAEDQTAEVRRPAASWEWLGPAQPTAGPAQQGFGYGPAPYAAQGGDTQIVPGQVMGGQPPMPGYGGYYGGPPSYTGGWGYPMGQPLPPQGKKAPRRLRLVGAAAALLLVGGAAGGGAAIAYQHSNDTSSATGIAGSTPNIGQSPQQSQPQAPSQGRQGRHGDGNASRFSTPGHASAAQSVGVVDINTRLKYEGARAAGTGMILTSSGEVLTNNHVVEGATKIKVTIVTTGKKYTAKVVGTDKVDDVAVLQLVGASGLQTVTTNTGTVQVGDAVTAVGNAMGAGGVPSAAEGSITGLNRSITTQSEGGVEGERLTGLIEVNAMVVSGDSGGPLLDADGKVIGMDTAASSSPAQSTGFAIPISKALSIADQITSGHEGGNITLGVPAFLGVTFSNSVFSQGGSGAVVSGVLRNTPAYKAGIVAGDTIKSVDGTAVTSGDQLRTVLGNYDPGQTVTVTWADSQGGSHSASITLMAGPAE